jgi:hypothetical protein
LTVGISIPSANAAGPINVSPGATISLIASGSDSDHWTEGNTQGDEADSVTPTWSANSGEVLADAADPWKATWTAPATPGTYTVTLSGDDGVGQFNDDSRSDTRTFEVPPPGPSVEILQTDVTPNPATVGTLVEANLNAQLNLPTGITLVSETVWSWDIVQVEYRESLTAAWNSQTPGYSTAIAYGMGGKAYQNYTFSAAGFYRITLRATATYYTSAGEKTVSNIAVIG